MVGTSAPSTKNFLKDVLCCNSRAHETRLLRMLCSRTSEKLREEIVRITGREARDTNTCRCVRELKQFDATLNARRSHHVSLDIKLHVRTLLLKDCQNNVKCMFFCERVQSESCFAAVLGTSTPPVVNEVQTAHGASNMARPRAPSTKKPPCVALQLTGSLGPAQ